MKILLGAILAMVACSTAAERKSLAMDANQPALAARHAQQSLCGVTPTTKITPQGVAQLAIGASAAFVKEHCRVILDTVAPGPDALPIRTLTVDMTRDTIEAVIVDDKVWRLEIGGLGFVTQDSQHVGMTITRLLDSGDIRGHEGEGQLYVVLANRCGISFRLTYVPKDTEHRTEWTARDIAALPASTRIDQILVFGCEPS